MNRQEFDNLTQKKYEGEPVEFFRCPECRVVFMGFPDAHIAFYDAANLSKTVAYNIPKEIICPVCSLRWYNISEKAYKVHAVSLSDARKTQWRWEQCET